MRNEDNLKFNINKKITSSKSCSPARQRCKRLFWEMRRHWLRKLALPPRGVTRIRKDGWYPCGALLKLYAVGRGGGYTRTQFALRIETQRYMLEFFQQWRKFLKPTHEGSKIAERTLSETYVSFPMKSYLLFWQVSAPEMFHDSLVLAGPSSYPWFSDYFAQCLYVGFFFKFIAVDPITMYFFFVSNLKIGFVLWVVVQKIGGFIVLSLFI